MGRGQLNFYSGFRTLVAGTCVRVYESRVPEARAATGGLESIYITCLKNIPFQLDLGHLNLPN